MASHGPGESGRLTAIGKLGEKHTYVQKDQGERIVDLLGALPVSFPAGKALFISLTGGQLTIKSPDGIERFKVNQSYGGEITQTADGTEIEASSGIPSIRIIRTAETVNRSQYVTKGNVGAPLDLLNEYAALQKSSDGAPLDENRANEILAKLRERYRSEAFRESSRSSVDYSRSIPSTSGESRGFGSRSAG